MKINKIFLRNINSFKGEHTLDFTESPLLSAGLFAIVGPTGAGKSTLLDVITLALFNRIPRFDKKISKDLVASAGSILTRGERECVVEVTYSCKEGVFTSKWWIEVNRNNKLNDYGMELLDCNSGNLLPLKKSEIPDKNQQLIGLSFDQFNKSILLSQGEFARFLKSGKDERGKLLEDITGMQIYRQLGKQAFQEYKDKAQSLTELRNQRTAAVNKLVSEDLEQEWTEALKVNTATLEQATIQLEQLTSQLTIKQEVASLLASKQEKEQELLRVQALWKAFEEEKEPLLLMHEKAIPFEAQVLTLNHEEKTVQSLRQRLQEQTSLLTDYQQKAEVNLGNIARLIKQEVQEENALLLLQEFRQQIADLQAQISQQEGVISAKEQQLDELIKKINKPTLKTIPTKAVSDASLGEITLVAQGLKKQEAAYMEIIQVENLDEIVARQAQLDKEMPIYAELSQLITDYGTHSTAQKEILGDIEQQTKTIEVNTPLWDKMQETIQRLSQEITALENQKEQLGKSYNFESERHKLLKEGEACPLCGSVEHPFLSHYANNYVEVDLRLKEQKEAEKKATQESTTLKTKLDTAQQLLEKAIERNQIVEQKKQACLTAINELKAQLKLDKVGNKSWIEEKIQQLSGQKEAIRALEKSQELLNDLRLLHKLAKETKILQEERSRQKAHVTTLYAGKNIHQDSDVLQQAFSNVRSQLTTTSQQKIALETELKQKEPALEVLHRTLEQDLKTANFASIESLKEATLTTEKVQALRKEREQLRTDCATFAKFTEDLSKRYQEKQLQDSSPLTIQEVTTLRTELLEHKVAVEKEVIDFRVRLETQTSHKKEIANYDTQLATKEVANLKWELLNKYIGDAEGKKFSTFAQGLTLSRLIALSNHRLAELSDRYLIGKPLDSEEDELMVIDQYMGNERRSVKTLSGGETFMLSLSLALALSDLASKNVKLESLFIDEGFGTLDPETLDLALGTLEKLQQEGQKNIGVISHVEAIKERIATQVRLERNNRGFSKISVV